MKQDFSYFQQNGAEDEVLQSGMPRNWFHLSSWLRFLAEHLKNVQFLQQAVSRGAKTVNYRFNFSVSVICLVFLELKATNKHRHAVIPKR